MEFSQLEYLMSLDSFRERGGEHAVLASGNSSLVVFRDPWLKVSGRTPVFFGCFKPSNIMEENQHVFSDLEGWSRSRNANEIWGPIDYSTFLNYRLRLTHLDHQPFPGEPANGPRELEVLEQMGYSIGQKYFTHYLDHLDSAREWAERNRLFDGIETLGGYEVVYASELDLDRKREELFEVTHHIFSDNLFFKPVRIQLFERMYAEITSTMCRQTSAFLLDAEKKITGYFINYPDPRDADRVLIKTAGVAPSSRMLGLTFLALLAKVISAPSGYKKAALCLMREGNFPAIVSKNFFDAESAYALFRKSV